MSHLGNATRALEIVDTRLVAIQGKLARIAADDPGGTHNKLEEIVDHLDLILGDLRAAAGWVAEHECPQPARSWDELEKTGDAAWSIHGEGWAVNTGGGKFFITRELVEEHGRPAE